MALLIDIKNPEWMQDAELRDALLRIYPHGDIRCADDAGDPADIEMLAVSSYFEGEALHYPNLKLIQKTGAGVNNILADTLLPESVQVTRLRSDTSAYEMAEYSLACVLQEQRHLLEYRQNQSGVLWQAVAPRRAEHTTVAVLGLGRIGSIVARCFVANRFNVVGWSRSEKTLASIECYHGSEQLPKVLARADYVVTVLPSTPDTVHLFNRKIFSLLNPRAVIINVGRGDLINEVELLEALDDGQFARAYLDVVEVEPLPAQSPLWRHEKVVITPHISGWHLGEGVNDIAENFRRLECEEPFLHLVDRKIGY